MLRSLTPFAAALLFTVLIAPVLALPASAASEATVLHMLKAPVAGDATLGSLLGSWRGAGKVRRGADSAAEAAQCRFTNSWAAKERLTRLVFTCRGTDFSFTADGYIGRDGAVYRGAWSTTTGVSATMAGRKSGSGIRLTVAPTGKPPGSLSLRVGGRTLNAKLTARDPKSGKAYTAFETSLRK